MKINRNMSAVLANRQLLRTENKLAASVERLSSGYKINKAGDNPAGLAISSKMKAQIDALDQAESNASDGVSALNIADGALNEVSSILQRIRELCVQAANGTNSYSDRQSMQAEIDKLTDEVDRISSDTEYNTKALLDGSSDVRVYSEKTDRMYISESVLPGEYSLEVIAAAESAEYVMKMPSGAASGTIIINDVGMDYTPGMNEESFYECLRNTAEQAGCIATRNDDGSYTIATAEYGSNEELILEVSKDLAEDLSLTDESDAVESEDGGSYILDKLGKDAEVTLTKGFSDSATASVSGTRIKITDMGGFSMDFMLKKNAEQKISIEVTDIGSMTLQIGANQYQDMEVRIPEVSSKSLYLDTVDVTVYRGPEKGMNTLDDAIAKVSAVRSGIGAYTNRLEYATSSLSETQENMTAAYANIIDTDMAEEMTEYTQRSVLEQASISVLSQANDLPQQVLSLLQ